MIALMNKHLVTRVETTPYPTMTFSLWYWGSNPGPHVYWLTQPLSYIPNPYNDFLIVQALIVCFAVDFLNSFCIQDVNP
jgi:hypothetical protein